MISAPSVVSALIFYSGVLCLVCVLRVFAPALLKKGGASILLWMSAFATLRLFLPFELPTTYLLRSWTLLGAPVRILRTYPEVMTYLLEVWIVGAVLFVVRDAFTLYRAYKTSSGYVRVDDERVLAILKRCPIPYPVVVSPDVGVPYVEGIFRHTIYLPILELPEHEIELVLAHEVQHIRGHDSVVKFFFRLLLAVMWWDIFAHWFWHGLGDLLELRCDGKMTRHMTEQERIDYGQTLSHMAASLTGKKPMSPLAVNEFIAAGRDEFIKQRMDIILYGTSEPLRKTRVLSGCLFLVLFCASYLLVVQPASIPSEEKFEEKTGVSYYGNQKGPEIGDKMSGDAMTNSFIFKGSDGSYQLYINYEFSRFLTEDELNSDPYQNLYIFEEGKQK